MKLFNPLIWLWNYFKYTAHLDMYKDSDKYVPYNFEKEDTKYF